MNYLKMNKIKIKYYTNNIVNLNSMNKIIFDTFVLKNSVNESKIDNEMVTDEIIYYLNKNKNLNSLIFGCKEVVLNIKSCVFVTEIQNKVFYALFDSIVDYIITYNCYSEITDIINIYNIFKYISPEKLYEFIIYIYNLSNDTIKSTFFDNFYEKIYNILLYNNIIIKHSKYVNYENIREDDISKIENVVYPYYLLVEKLKNANIISNIVYRAREIDINCKLSNNELYINIVHDIFIDMKIHRNYDFVV